MHNFFNDLLSKLFTEKDQNFTSFSFFYGWMVGIYTLLDTPGLAMIFSLEFLIKSIGGISFAVITAISVKFFSKLYETKIEPKIFKSKRNAKQKKDNQKRA